ncbi:MAG: hypothetical protein JJE47_10820 [Acidimicrobiia bacterium]|nr:hypothetical protein [Acidimicrobiia bacterium]
MMIEWFWVLAIGLAALLVGYLLGGWWLRRSMEEELDQGRSELAAARDKSAVLGDRVKGLETDLAAALARGDQAEKTLLGLTPQVDVLNSTVGDLKQQAADAATARRAAEAALAAHEVERQKAVDQAASARAAASEASDKYDAITAEFVSLKRSLREALDALSRAEGERDTRAAEALEASNRAQMDVAEAERARDEAVEDAIRERDLALAAAEAASQRRADAGTLRKEIMAAQRELADLRDELAGRDRQIRDLEAHAHPTKHEPDPAAKAFAGFDPEVGSALSDEDMAAAVSAIGLPADSDDEMGDDDDADQPADDDDDDDDDDDIFTVDDLPGGDWEPDQPVDPVATPPSPIEKVDDPKSTDEAAALTTGHEDTGTATASADIPEADEINEIDDPISDGTRQDDLRLVKGIGPKFERLLHARNITSFAQIAELTDDAEWETYLDTFAGRIEREQWREQATELRKEQDE